ncbi:MAG: hypothetical protein JJ975_14590 [Bacteroidia bacterium]|nr:hypothetical protein [Bacteroidia bacterium]
MKNPIGIAGLVTALLALLTILVQPIILSRIEQKPGSQILAEYIIDLRETIKDESADKEDLLQALSDKRSLKTQQWDDILDVSFYILLVVSVLLGAISYLRDERRILSILIFVVCLIASIILLSYLTMAALLLFLIVLLVVQGS